MRIISNFFYFSLFLLFFILNFAPYSYGIGNVDWVLLKENNEGKEWIDKGSIKQLPNNEISVLTKFFKNPTNSDCLLYTSPSPRDRTRSRMPSSA